MFPAYAGTILRVDLSKHKVYKKRLLESLAKKYIGGKGIATRFLYDEVKPGTGPLDPENKLIFATGPATGTAIPNKGHIVCCKSPLTGIYASSSSGGHFGAELKYAGYDVLIIEGRADRPVYLWIDGDDVQIREAKHLWGKDGLETEAAIKEELRDEEVKVARIGPAGENLVKIACIINDYSRVNGRCGFGAVMGSKNLKAIAVRGSNPVEVADMDGILEFLKEFIESVKEKAAGYSMYGPTASVDVGNILGTQPVRYWSKGVLDGYQKINREALYELGFKNKACHSCVVRCGKIREVKEGPYAGTVVEGVDYETIYALGSLCENNNLESILRSNQLCDILGLDTISTGNVIAFAMECYERGIIDNEDTDGIELKFGNHKAIVQIIEKIANRKGLGDILAEGVREAARQIGKGSEEFAVHIKGLEPAGWDPRGMKGISLSFAVADRGGCHLSGGIYTYESRGGLDRLQVEGKAQFLHELEVRYAVTDTLILCRFNRAVYPWETIMKTFPLLTGVKMSENDLKEVGERIVTLARAFSVREGISRKDDYWPDRFYREPIPEGPSKGMILNREEFDGMLDEYYELNGWDVNGIPTKKTLATVEIEKTDKEIEPTRAKVTA